MELKIKGYDSLLTHKHNFEVVELNNVYWEFTLTRTLKKGDDIFINDKKVALDYLDTFDLAKSSIIFSINYALKDLNIHSCIEKKENKLIIRTDKEVEFTETIAWADCGFKKKKNYKMKNFFMLLDEQTGSKLVLEKEDINKLCKLWK